MTPNKNHHIPEQFVFGQVKSSPVVVNLKGEPVTSDAELTLIAELDRKREITSRFARCFKYYRDPNKVLYPVHNLIAQSKGYISVSYTHLTLPTILLV